MPNRDGVVQKKILLLLWGGLVLGLSGSPRAYFRILKGIAKEWEYINRQTLQKAVRRLYYSKLLEEKYNADGSITLILTDEGKKKVLTYKIGEMKIEKPTNWDKKWRVVLFDIPEKRKRTRDALRCHLKNLGFYEFQKSVFIYPYDCKNEIDYIIEFYNLRKFVRFIVADSLDNELHLKSHFKIY